MQHNDYVKELNGEIGESLVRQLCQLSPTIRARYSEVLVKFWCLKEFVVRFDKGIVLPDGRFERCNKRMDTMIFVEPSLNSLAQKWTFKIVVEVKANIKDLLDDNKMPNYLGWSDFFLIAVPDGLIKAALRKAAADSRIGVVSLTSGKIHKIPAWQDVSLGRKYEVMEQAFYRYTNKGGMIRTFKMTN